MCYEKHISLFLSIGKDYLNYILKGDGKWRKPFTQWTFFSFNSKFCFCLKYVNSDTKKKKCDVLDSPKNFSILHMVCEGNVQTSLTTSHLKDLESVFKFCGKSTGLRGINECRKEGSLHKLNLRNKCDVLVPPFCLESRVWILPDIPGTESSLLLLTANSLTWSLFERHLDCLSSILSWQDHFVCCNVFIVLRRSTRHSQ